MTRGDLPPGLAAAQAVHAAFEFSVEHPAVVDRWTRSSSYLVVLAVPDEAALLQLGRAAQAAGDVDWLIVREPDLADEATALAVGPGRFHRQLASLPLFGKEAVPV